MITDYDYSSIFRTSPINNQYICLFKFLKKLQAVRFGSALYALKGQKPLA